MWRGRLGGDRNRKERDAAAIEWLSSYVALSDQIADRCLGPLPTRTNIGMSRFIIDTAVFISQFLDAI